MDNNNKPKEKCDELKKYDQNLIVNSYPNNDIKEDPTKEFKIDKNPANDSKSKTITNEDMNTDNEKKRMDMDKTILKELEFKRNIDANLIDSVCSDNMDCQYLDTQESKKNNENNDLPINKEFQMTNTVKSEDNIQKPNTTDKESPPFTEAEQTSENDNPKSKCNFDSKKAKIMNCKSLDRPLATNDDLKKGIIYS